MDSDIVIAHKTTLLPITTIAKKLGLTKDDLELYGDYKAKISYETLSRLNKQKKQGTLILVTAINPTPAGEGKTTVTIGLGILS